MQTANALARLIELQDAILTRIGEAETASRIGPSSLEMLAKRRWEMVRRLREYQLFKHNEIFDPAIKYGTIYHVNLACRMKTMCEQANDFFLEYVRRWSSAAVAAEWEAYQTELNAMCKALQNHISIERKNIHALLAGSPRTRSLSCLSSLSIKRQPTVAPQYRLEL